jgi:uncharacterized damage-inducible protein DinB
LPISGLVKGWNSHGWVPKLEARLAEEADMIAEQMRKLFTFNRWAWKRVFDSVEQVGDTAYREARQLFENSIHGTLVHCMSAEYIWLSRCQGHSSDSLFNPEDFADFASTYKFWRPIFDNWASYLHDLTDEQCSRVIDYSNTQGNDFSLPLVDILQHVVNHATEHRSQLTPILFHMGLPTKPLDYVYFRLQL